MENPSAAVTVRPLAPTDWPVIKRLFGPNGASGGCWCMWWRVKGGKSWEACKGEKNQATFRALVEGGSAHGVLAFAGDEPVGWCNIGPRDDFYRLLNSRVLQRQSGHRRWSVACFYIRPKWRRQGVARALLEQAVREAFARGAEEIEGYPRENGSGAWTGLPAMFEAAGFQREHATNSSRLIFVKRR